MYNGAVFYMPRSGILKIIITPASVIDLANNNGQIYVRILLFKNNIIIKPYKDYRPTKYNISGLQLAHRVSGLRCVNYVKDCGRSWNPRPLDLEGLAGNFCVYRSPGPRRCTPSLWFSCRKINHCHRRSSSELILHSPAR
jgi:hypothetical protein